MKLLQLLRITMVNNFRQSRLQIANCSYGICFNDFLVFKSSNQVFAVAQNLLSAWSKNVFFFFDKNY